MLPIIKGMPFRICDSCHPDTTDGNDRKNGVSSLLTAEYEKGMLQIDLKSFFP